MMKKILIALAGILAANANAFVLVGPTDAGLVENTLAWGAPNQTVISANLVDDMGTPKRIDEFYRWNCPNLTYGFDASFVQFFGEQGAREEGKLRLEGKGYLVQDGDVMEFRFNV